MGFRRGSSRGVSFTLFFETFQKNLALNNEVLAIIAEMGDKLSGDYIFDSQYIQSSCRKISGLVLEMIVNLNTMAPSKYLVLHDAFQKVNREITADLTGHPHIPESDEIIPYSAIHRDMEDIVGAKNATLGEIKNVLKLPTPDGFAITTAAFDHFLKHNHQWVQVNALTDAWRNQDISVDKTAEKLQELILGGNIPGDLRKAMIKTAKQTYRADAAETPGFAVRSSAWGEDGEASFAGQYLTLLNQPTDKIPDGFKAVLASMYTPSAMEYRVNKGFSEGEVVMAVGCQSMINAKVSGVIFTFDPRAPESNCMLITAVWGMGAASADGRMASDQYTVNRSGPFEDIRLQVTRKEKKLVMDHEGGTMLAPVPEDEWDIPCLTRDQLQMLTEYGRVIEKHFKTPQDIEFAVDHDNKIFILQARPLVVSFDRVVLAKELPEIMGKYPVIMDNKGMIIQKGIGVGKVFKVGREDDLDAFPNGAILVAKYTSPRFAKVIRKAGGILTDVGSATGHMSTIAREFRVPAIVNTGEAMNLLENGQEITLDADENKVYDGIIKELYEYQMTEAPIEESYEYRLLRRVHKKISVLNLVDPSSKRFTPANCRTFHDIIRFVHEKIVEELIDRQYYHRHGPKAGTIALKLAVPLDLVLVDINGGLSAESSSKTISPEQIQSIPMRAFIDGLLMPGVWNTEPMAVDFGSFMSSMTRTFSTNLSNPKEIGQNLAVLSKYYTNISLRLGYHFNMIDAYINGNPNSSYAYFRFFGGVTDVTRRSRRAQFLAEVLTHHDFLVEQRGDLVVARVKKLTTQRMLQKLYLLGVIVAFARQLDVQMASDQHVHMYADRFKQLITSNLKHYAQGEISV